MKACLSFLLFVQCLSLSAQEQQYFDSLGNRVTDLTKAKYYNIYQQHPDSAGLITEIQYFLNGQKKLEKSYSDTAKKVIHGTVQTWYENGQLLQKSHYIAGKPDGDLTLYFDNGVMKRKEFYIKGEMQTGACFNREGKEVPYFDYFVMALFPGGAPGWRNYLLTTLKYPKKSIKSDEQGTVIVQFIVKKDGSISDITINKSVSELLDKEALRVIREMPTWKPALLDGEIVSSYYKQPIVFKLQL